MRKDHKIVGISPSPSLGNPYRPGVAPVPKTIKALRKWIRKVRRIFS